MYQRNQVNLVNQPSPLVEEQIEENEESAEEGGEGYSEDEFFEMDDGNRK
jgi:hypothetical protein